mmetsp:Transcript_4890/g.10778  ORF Transcript_4890/g.10778 Transcript_4890/m.10778 type:complete len:282 (-) Transcript_4890:32-877(-)
MANASFNASMFGGSMAEVVFKTAVLRPFLHHQGVEGGTSFLKANNQRPTSRVVRSISPSVQPFAEHRQHVGFRQEGRLHESLLLSPRSAAGQSYPLRKSRSPLIHMAENTSACIASGAVQGDPVVVTGRSGPQRHKAKWDSSYAANRSKDAAFSEEPDDPRVHLPAHRIGDELPAPRPQLLAPRKAASSQSMPSLQKLRVKGLQLPVVKGGVSRLADGGDFRSRPCKQLIKSGTSSHSVSSSCSRFTLPTPGINHFPLYDYTPRTSSEGDEDADALGFAFS